MNKKNLMYLAIFLAGVWLGPKVAPTLQKIPVVGGIF